MNNLPALNIDLLSKVVTWAYADAEDEALREEFFGAAWGSWNQGSWFNAGDGQSDNVCGSTYCIAGQTVAQVGFKMNVGWDGTATKCQQQMFKGLDDNGHPVYEAVGSSRYIADVGREVLGLTEDEGSLLFDGANSIEKVVGLAMGFAARRNVRLDLRDEVEQMGRKFWADYRLAEGYLWSDEFYSFPQHVAESLGYTEPEPEPEVCHTCGQVLPD